MIKKEYQNKLTEVENIPYNNMKQEWSDKDNKIVNKAIKNLFSMKTLTDHRGNKRTMYTLNNIEDFFGLPYTSSSSFAMVGNTNTRYCLDQEENYNIDCFGLGLDNKVYIFCTDNEENEKVYQVI